MAQDIIYTASPITRDLESGLLQISAMRNAFRTEFVPVPGAATGILYAKIPVATTGDVTSASFLPVEPGLPTGEIVLTTIDPARSLPGAHLFVFTDGIVPVTSPLPMYRRLHIRNGTYSTIGLAHEVGNIYAMIIGGPAVDTLAMDIALVIKSQR